MINKTKSTLSIAKTFKITVDNDTIYLAFMQIPPERCDALSQMRAAVQRIFDIYKKDAHKKFSIIIDLSAPRAQLNFLNSSLKHAYTSVISNQQTNKVIIIGKSAIQKILAQFVLRLTKIVGISNVYWCTTMPEAHALLSRK